MISIQHLTKDYGKGKGVFDLSFEIAKGEAFGYLGPNGSGKTTTIRHLMGFLRPDSGLCLIQGKDCQREAAEIQHFTGYLPGEIAFFEAMNGHQFLTLIGEMRGMKSTKKRDELIEIFQLDASGKIRKMSKGMKQKLGIVAAFMHNPDVLILDEPTDGLDPLMQQRFVELIHAEKADGKTILMSSHSFVEIERTCDRTGIIRAGRLAAIERIAALRAVQQKKYIATFADETEARAFAAGIPECLPTVLGTTVEAIVRENLREFLGKLASHPVVHLETAQLGLEDVFMHFYGEEKQQ